MVNIFKFSKYLLINLFFNLLVIVVHGQKIKEFIVNKKEHLLQEFEDSSGKSNYIIYPTLAYTPETKTEIGLVNLYLFYANKNNKNRLSEINTFSFYTAEKQYGVLLDHAIYGDGDNGFTITYASATSFTSRTVSTVPAPISAWASVLRIRSPMTPKRDPARRKNMRIKGFWESWLGNLDSNQD